MLGKFRTITLRILGRIFKVYTTIDNFIFSQEFINSIIFAILLIFAGLIRYFALDYNGSDYQNFLSPWYDYIVQHGGWKALGNNFANYTPPYLYFLVILTYLPVPKLVGIKLISIFFDFILAYLVFSIINFCQQIREKQDNYNEILKKDLKKENNQVLVNEQNKITNLESKNLFKTQNFSKILIKHLPIIAFLVVLFSPTLIFNGAFWAQCDVIYTTFLVASFFAILKKKYFFAIFWFAISLSFKLQAMFFLPVLIVLLMLRQINFLHFLIIPIVYILSILPSFLIGRNFVELLRIYVDQGGAYNSLTMNSPNFYHWFGGGNYEILAKMGMVIAGIAFVGVCYFFYHLGKQIWSSNLSLQSNNSKFYDRSQRLYFSTFYSEFETKNSDKKSFKNYQFSLQSSQDSQYLDQNLSNSLQNLDNSNSILQKKLTKKAKFIELFNLFNFQKKSSKSDKPTDKQVEIQNQNLGTSKIGETKFDKFKYEINWNLETKIIDFWMNLTMISVLTLPYFLPKMHERYFFVADIFAILYVFWRPQRFWIAILINLCSFFSYGPFLLGTKPFDFSYLSMALFITIIYLLVINIRENLEVD